MNNVHTNAAQTIFQRILDLHISGRTSEEITAKIFTSEKETAKFWVESLIEIVLWHWRTGTADSRKDEKEITLFHRKEPSYYVRES